MKLTELEPQFYRYETRVEEYTVVVGDPLTWKEGDPTQQVTRPRQYKIPVETLAEAQGVCFLCPVCFVTNGGRIGTHLCEVTFEGRGAEPTQGTQNERGPVRWTVAGTGVDDLTTTPSILLLGGCGWHGYITAGEVTGT